MKNELLVICPVYNEEDCVEEVVKEWIPTLENINAEYKFLFIDDGSTDKTLQVISGLRQHFPKLDVVSKENSGHGQTCIFGYRAAVKENYTWVFQIDSDGQCDPKYFKKLWALRNEHDIIFGNRTSRDDGFFRVIVSFVLQLTILIALRQYVRDANVPYRLIKTEKLTNNLDYIPKSMGLANVLVSILLNYKYKIKWVNISFRDRIGGSPKVKPLGFVSGGITVYKDLRGQKHLFS